MTTGLLITDNMKKKAKTNKFIGLLTISVLDFLSLTCKGDPVLWANQEQKEGITKSLEMYNEYVRRGESDIIPFLSVDMHTGVVLEHEGRHRAAALMERRIFDMQVAISLRDHGYLTYYVEPNIDDYSNPKRWAKRYMGVQDIPGRFLGQFNKSESVRIDKSKFVSFYSEKETTLASGGPINLMRAVGT